MCSSQFYVDINSSCLIRNLQYTIIYRILEENCVQSDSQFISQLNYMGLRCHVMYVKKKSYLADIEFDNGGAVEVVKLQEDWHFKILTSVGQHLLHVVCYVGFSASFLQCINIFPVIFTFIPQVLFLKQQISHA